MAGVRGHQTREVHGLEILVAEEGKVGLGFEYRGGVGTDNICAVLFDSPHPFMESCSPPCYKLSFSRTISIIIFQTTDQHHTHYSNIPIQCESFVTLQHIQAIWPLIRIL